MEQLEELRLEQEGIDGNDLVPRGRRRAGAPCAIGEPSANGHIEDLPNVGSNDLTRPRGIARASTVPGEASEELRKRHLQMVGRPGAPTLEQLEEERVEEEGLAVKRSVHGQ